jgi:hypothetical protein
MQPELELARRYRSRASEYRMYADQATNPSTKETLTRMSLSYDEWADRAEERAALSA